MMRVSAENLGKRFNREWIFRKFDYHFEAGKTYAITGPNGSGKSTLMQILWGQSPPSTGNLSYKKDDREIDHDQIFKHITIAAPYMDLVDEFTLHEQIAFHFKIKSPREEIFQEEMLERMNLAAARNKYIGNFSSGMKQRAKLALSFFTKAEMVFLDEPGTNLDKFGFQWYRDELKKLPDATTVFIASNNPEEYADNAQMINILHYK